MERMERELYETAVEGNAFSLLDLLQRDALILDKNIVTCYGETPLHIAAMLGHLEFLLEILRRKPELAGELDSRRSSPLHLASAKGYTEIVRALLFTNPQMCFARDRDGNNPIHIAVMKGRVNVLEELLRAQPDAARVKMERGETILHLCVQYNQLEALKLLVTNMHLVEELVNSRDNQGNTILHLAVVDKQFETINFLLSTTTIDVNAQNVYGFTAMDILAQSRRDAKDMDIADSLQSSGALKSRDIPPLTQHPGITPAAPRDFPSSKLNNQTEISLLSGSKEKSSWVREQEERLERQRDSLMVVASLIATMAYETGLNPPGGVWDDNPQANTTDIYYTQNAHAAGTSIISDLYFDYYLAILIANTISFISSLTIILLLVSGLPFVTRRVFIWILIVVMWVAITSSAITYVVSLLVIATPNRDPLLAKVGYVLIVFWIVLMGLLLLTHCIYFLVHRKGKLTRKVKKMVFFFSLGK